MQGEPARDEKNPDEVNVLRLLLVVWVARRWIAAVTILAAVTGVAVALLSPSLYRSDAIVMLKEREGARNPGGLLSQLAPIGQFGAGNNMEKIQVIIKSAELADTLIRKHGLLPELYPKAWDAEKRDWKDPKKAPSLRAAIDQLRENVLKIDLQPRSNFLQVSAVTHDSTLSKRIVEYYLDGLNEKIRLDIMREANSSRRYLESQMMSTSDPLLLGKIQDLIAYELEKSMLVSSRAIEILEHPRVPRQRVSPQRKRIVMLFLVGGFALSLGGVFVLYGIRNLRAALERETARERREHQG